MYIYRYYRYYIYIYIIYKQINIYRKNFEACSRPNRMMANENM